MQDQISINFDNQTTAEGNKLAQDLKSYLLKYENIEVDIINENENTQDFGATVIAILGTGVAGTLAKGLMNWLLKTQGKKLTIKKNGEIKGENLSSDDIKRILDKF